MKKCNKGAAAVNSWRVENKVTVAQLAACIGDEGKQCAKWLSGHREQIPLRLVTAISHYTDIPVWEIATPEQSELMQRVVAVVARDVRWPGEAA